MTRGMKIGMAIAGVVLVIGIVAVVWVSTRSTGDTTTNTNTTTSNTNGGPITTVTTGNSNADTNKVVETREETVAIDDSASVLRLARSVVARYGSFSNQNNFENITSLEAFMTADFRARSAKYISENQADAEPAEYYGISTEVISLEMVSLEESTATVNVLSQRIEEKAGEDPSAFTQTAEVVFEKTNGDWLVDSITWQ